MKPGKLKDGNILKNGYLLKQSDVLKQWHLRYFVLSKECLCYYRTERESTEEPPKELIFFNDMSLYVEDVSHKQTKYCLKIVKRSSTATKTSRTFFLCCFSEQERNEWLAQILRAKAIALVVNPASWMRSNNEEPGKTTRAAENSSGAEVLTTGGSEVLASARGVLQRYRRKLSLGSNPVLPTSFLMVDDLCLENGKRAKTKLNSYWRNTLTDLSIQSIMA